MVKRVLPALSRCHGCDSGVDRPGVGRGRIAGCALGTTRFCAPDDRRLQHRASSDKRRQEVGVIDRDPPHARSDVAATDQKSGSSHGGAGAEAIRRARSQKRYRDPLAAYRRLFGSPGIQRIKSLAI